MCRRRTHTVWIPPETAHNPCLHSTTLKNTKLKERTFNHELHRRRCPWRKRPDWRQLARTHGIPPENVHALCCQPQRRVREDGGGWRRHAADQHEPHRKRVGGGPEGAPSSAVPNVPRGADGESSRQWFLRVLGADAGRLQVLRDLGRLSTEGRSRRQ